VSAGEASTLSPGQPVIVNLASEDGGERSVSNGVVRQVAGAVVSLTCPGPATRFEVGRAVEVAAADGDLVLTATVVAGDATTADAVSLALGPPIAGPEVRAWTRLQLAVPACVSTSSGDAFHNFIGVTRDVSVGGMAVHGFAPVPPGPAVVVLHIDGAHRLALLARTLDVTRPADGTRGWVARLQFVALDARLRRELGGFIARAILEPGSLAPRGTRSGIDDMQHFRAVTRRGRPHAYSWRDQHPPRG
jgi:hypothetical protein